MALFQFIRNLFSRDEQQEESVHPQVGRVILLLEAAIYDHHFAEEEQQVIEDILCDHYQMSPNQAHELIETATAHRERFPDIHSFTRDIARLPREERITLMEEIWRVIFADGKLDMNEEHYARKMQKLLRIDHSEWIAAKQRIVSKDTKGSA